MRLTLRSWPRSAHCPGCPADVVSHACGWSILKVILHKPSLGLHRSRRETRVSSCSELCCVCSRSSSPDKPSVSCEDARAERWSTHNAERPRLLFRTARVRRHVTARGGRWGAARVRSLSPPCRAKPSEVGSASWLASQSALPAAHIICARTWGETTRSQYSAASVPRRSAPAARYGPSGRCASRRRPAEVSGREIPVLTRGVCLLTQASLGPDLV